MFGGGLLEMTFNIQSGQNTSLIYSSRQLDNNIPDEGIRLFEVMRNLSVFSNSCYRNDGIQIIEENYKLIWSFLLWYCICYYCPPQLFLQRYTMNLQEFHKLLMDIDSDSAQTAELARYCLTKTTNHEREIAKIFGNYLQADKYHLDFKFKIIEVMTHILLELHGKKFVGHFSVRIRSFLKNNAIPIARDEQLAGKAVELFNQWKERKVFADSFLKIIREAAPVVLGVEEVIDVSPFVKYSKSFLMAYQDVAKVDEARLIYKTFCERQSLISKIQELKKEIGQDTMEGDKGLEHKRILMKQCESYIAELIKIINNFQKTSKRLCQMIQDEACSLQITEEEIVSAMID